jgi:hypothetical protein
VVGALVEVGGVRTGDPVENRQPAPGGLNAAMLTNGGGRLFEFRDSGVVGVVEVEDLVVVAGSVAVDDVVTRGAVVGAAAGER